jgi:hypothetical protein
LLHPVSLRFCNGDNRVSFCLQPWGRPQLTYGQGTALVYRRTD